MSKLCFGCMQQKENSPICEHCSYDERAENQSHQLPVGTMLQNQYLVGKVLGQGGFGITYIGWDQHLSIPVAIKEYFPGGVVHRNTQWGTHITCDNGAAPEQFEKHKSKFLKEARTLAQLAGIPEIVQIKSFFPENDTAYIVMEYVQGITLKDHLKKLGRPMTESEALTVMEPVLKALQKVHDHGLIHRDISPDNIMLPTGGGVKLIDFGTVRYMDDSGKSKSTEAVLKPGFAPMEQYNTRGNLGTWTDVYAICATYHYLLTGKVPADVHDRMDEGESLTILRARAGISKKLISTLEKGMKLRAAERIQTIRELHQLLYPAQKNPPAKKQPKEKKAPPKKKDEPQKKEGSGKKGTVAIACALAAVAIGAAMMLLIPKQQASLSTPETTVAPVQTTSEATVPTVPETTEPITAESMAYAEAEQLQADGETARAAIAFGKLAGYKDARERSFELWRSISLQKTIDGCDSCTIAIRSDGSVVSTGAGGGKWENLVALCDGEAILTDGSVSLNGSFSSSEYYGWTNIVAISVGNVHELGLRNDGTVVASPPMPEYDYGQCNVSDWTDIVSIAAGWGISAGLRSDGTVVAVGHNEFGQCDDVAGWSDIAQLVPFGGDCHVVGLRSDGTVVATHNDIARYVSTWTDIVTISAGIEHVVGLRSDGTLLTAGWNTMGQCNVANWTDIVDISAGWWHTVGLRSDGTVVAVGSNEYGQCNVSGWTNIKLPGKDEPKPEESPIDPQAQYDAAEKLLDDGDTAGAAIAFGKLAGYKDARERSFDLWDQVAVRNTVDVGSFHTLALKDDGTVYVAGENVVTWNTMTQKAERTAEEYSQCDVDDWSNIVAVSASGANSVGLKSDGTVVIAGNMENHGPKAEIDAWKDIVSISVWNNVLMGLKMDGTVVVASNWVYKPDVSEWSDIIAVSAGAHLVGLKSDGTVVAAGNNDFGQCDVKSWTDIIKISNGGNYTAGLKADGTLVTAGRNDYDRCNVAGLSDIVEITAESGYSTISVKADGTTTMAGRILEWYNTQKWTDIVSVAASENHAVGLKSDGTLVATGLAQFGQCNVSDWTDIMLPTGSAPVMDNAPSE